MGRSGLAQDPENGLRTEGKGPRKEEEEQTHQDHEPIYHDRHPLPLVLALLMILQ